MKFYKSTKTTKWLEKVISNNRWILTSFSSSFNDDEEVFHCDFYCGGNTFCTGKLYCANDGSLTWDLIGVSK